jgi:sensor histidine kinase YesM
MNNKRIIIIQILFWFAFSVFNFVDELEYSDYVESLQYGMAQCIIMMVVVYANILILIPKLLYQQKYVKYGASLISITIISVLLMSNLDEDAHFYSELGYLIYEVVAFILFASGITSFWVSFEQIRIKQRLLEIEQSQITSELKFLKAQTKPHFLFNILNNINFLIHQNPKMASKTLLKLSDLLRYQLYETDAEFVEISREIMNIENYIDLEKTRMGDQLLLTANIDCVDESILVQPFLMLPLFENAFKHGKGIEKTRIDYSIKADRNQIILKIMNSVSSSDPNSESEERNNGLGIKNLKSRLKLLYPNRHKYNYELKNEMYTATLSIFIKENN